MIFFRFVWTYSKILIERFRSVVAPLWAQLCWNESILRIFFFSLISYLLRLPLVPSNFANTFDKLFVFVFISTRYFIKQKLFQSYTKIIYFIYMKSAFLFKFTLCIFVTLGQQTKIRLVFISFVFFLLLFHFDL